MKPENDTVIEIEAEIIDSPEPETEEIWYSALQVQDLAGLKKQHLQQAVVKLQTIYYIDLSALRRGAGRATEYSQFALDAIKLLNAGKLSELRRLVNQVPTSTPEVSSGLVISEYTPALDSRIAQLNQNANNTSASLNQNVMNLLAQIAAENQSAQQRDADLDNAEINAAQNRGAARALAVFQAEQKAQSEVLAQLRAMKLGGAE